MWKDTEQASAGCGTQLAAWRALFALALPCQLVRYAWGFKCLEFLPAIGKHRCCQVCECCNPLQVFQWCSEAEEQQNLEWPPGCASWCDLLREARWAPCLGPSSGEGAGCLSSCTSTWMCCTATVLSGTWGLTVYKMGAAITQVEVSELTCEGGFVGDKCKTHNFE